MTGQRRKLYHNKWAIYILRVLVVVVFIALWQAAVSFGVVKSLALAPPWQVLTQLSSWFRSGYIWPQLGHTMVVFLIGLAVGFTAGTIVGILAGTIPFIRNFTGPFVAFFNSIPRLILIPFFAIVFGFGYLPGICVTALVVFFVVVITVRKGVEEIQGDYVENAKMLGGSWLNLMRTVYLPGVAVWLLSAARVSVGFAFQAAIVTEFFGSSKGLGYLIVQGETVFNTKQIYAAIVVTALLAYLIDVALKAVEDHYIRWDLRT